MAAAVVSLKTLSQPSLTSAGTAQAITAGTETARSIIIYASKSNTGAVYIGSSDASSKLATGINLAPGEAYAFDGDNANGTMKMIQLSSIFFDGATTGNKLVVQYFE